jgi:CubicO group peptidase (beta-lactamase class C family)
MKVTLCVGTSILLLGASFSSLSEPLQSGKNRLKLGLEIDRYVAPYLEMNDFNGSILISKDNRVVFKKSYGIANRETQVNITPQTKFRIGSISKQFTACAILVLEERKLVALTDTIGKFIPDFPQGDRITLHMLLTHTSGVTRDLPDKSKLSKIGHTIGQLVDIVKLLPLDSEPGTKYQYSNLDYLLLADIVETASGKDYETFLSETIFVPLAMSSTGVDRHETILMQRAAGYQTGFGTDLVNAEFEDMSNEVGYGSLYSTPEDLLRWEQAWNTDRVLNKSSWIKMFTDYGHGYGYAISFGTLFGHDVVGHDGSVAGFNSFLRSFTKDHICIIYMGNIESGTLLKLFDGLAAIMFQVKYEIPARRPAPVVLTKAQLQPYVGTYALFPGFSIEVKLEGKGLYLSGGGSEFLALTSLSETHFFYRHLYGDITFVKDPSGKPTELIWRWGGSDGKEYHCPKTK